MLYNGVVTYWEQKQKRCNKNLLAQRQFVSAKTRQLQIKKEDLLNNEIFEKLLNARNQLNSNYQKDFEKYQKLLIESNSCSRKKWNLINEFRNFKRTAAKVSCLQISFGKLIPNKQEIANHFNYVFNQSGVFKFNNNDRKYQVENRHLVPLNFSFRFAPSHECLRVLLDLNKKINRWLLTCLLGHLN